MKRILSLFRMVGLDVERMRVALSDVPRYFRTRRQYWNKVSESHAFFPNGKPSPCLGDHKAVSGVGRGAYFYQDLWVARHIFQHVPERHIDVGSRVDGFVAHVAAFREVEAIDIRPLSDDSSCEVQAGGYDGCFAERFGGLLRLSFMLTCARAFWAGPIWRPC